MTENRVCFVIAPIGEPESDTRKRSDQILRHVITPAVRECGYDPIRADQISEPGMITSQVIQHVVDDPLVVADLTDRNPNVFYELAIRHAIKKPLVQIIRKGDPLPFDVAGTRTVSVDHRDLDSVESARKEITNQVRAIEKNSLEIDSPISVALDLQLLKQSDNPEQRSLADILSSLSEIRTSIASIEQRIGGVNTPNYRRFINYFSDYRPHDSDSIMKLVLSKAWEPESRLTCEQIDELLKWAQLLKAHEETRERDDVLQIKLQQKTMPSASVKSGES